MDKVLQQIADNPALLQAVRNGIEAEFALDNLNTTMTNDAIGQVVRANIDGRARVEEAFKKILSLKSVPQTPEKTNPAK